MRTVHGHGYAFSGTATDEAERGSSAPTRRIRPARPRRRRAGPRLIALGGLALLARREGPAVQPSAPIPARWPCSPFDDLSNDPDQAYVVDGLTEALVTRLAESGLPVVSRTSAMRYRASTRPRSEIAKELAADWLLEGSARGARRSSPCHRPAHRPARSRSLWTRTYECAFGDLPASRPRRPRPRGGLATGPHASAAGAALVGASRRPGGLRRVPARPLSARPRLPRVQPRSDRALAGSPRQGSALRARLRPPLERLLTLATVWAGEPPRPMRALPPPPP